MEKVTWYEVYGFVDNIPMNGTYTRETFDNLKEAEDYLDKHNTEDLYIDTWESNADGTGVAKRILNNKLNKL